MAFLNLAQLLERDPTIPFEVEKPAVNDATTLILRIRLLMSINQHQ